VTTTVAVLGAGGTIGPAIVRDLAEGGAVGGRGVERLVLLDLAGDRAAAVADEHGGGRATARAVDAADPSALAGALRDTGASVLVNAASYRLNLSAMTGALDAGCHYLDLGGLYHTTRRQLGFHDRYAAASLTAVLGMGASPGKTNLLAALAASQLADVRELHVSAAATDPTPAGHTGLAAPYAIETILDELTLPAVVVRAGTAEEVPALTGGGEILFPEPIGRRNAVYTLHSELATFPSSFPGLAEASFRLSLAPALAERVELLARCGVADIEPVSLPDGTRVVPRQVLLACVARAGAAVPPSNRTTAVHLVDAVGAGRDGPARVRAAAVTVPHEAWGLGGGVVSTAAPAAEAARRLLRGSVAGVGVLAPERAFEPGPFLTALAPTGCTVTVADLAP
jgi:saccharopine dehydrogenase-like NADP-dependent oxidoreductase